MKNIKTVIVGEVDDKRISLKKTLNKFPQIQIIGETSYIDEAKMLINTLQPNLVFFDIELFGLNSIDFIVDSNAATQFVFIVSEKNIVAIELKGVDYITNPISNKSIRGVIEKTAISMEETTDGILDSDDVFQSEQIILLNFGNKMNFIKIKDINFIEAFGNYTKVNMVDGKLSITYNSIKNWYSKLPENNFIQIHRSTIVNLLNVQKIEKWTNDAGRLYLTGVSKPFEISRSYFLQIKKKYKM